MADAREQRVLDATRTLVQRWDDEDGFGADIIEALREAVHTLDGAPPVSRCPTCDSPSAKLHPAMQWEGEVQPCRDAWHDSAELAAFARRGRSAQQAVDEIIASHEHTKKAGEGD
jgi:hypothetical protein